MFFNRKNQSVYIGYDIKEFNDIRNLLETNGIDYDYKVNNHQGQFLAPGAGTIRGSFGSLGTDLDRAYEYEIKVFPKDAEKAAYSIRKLKENIH